MEEKLIRVKTFRPFNSTKEFVSYYTTISGKKECIWVKNILTGIEYLVTAIDENNGTVYLSGTERWYTLENLMFDFKFVDGTECAIYEWVEEK